MIKEFLQKLTDYIFRKKTLQSCLYFTVAFFLSELALIGKNQELVELCDKIQANNNDNWKGYGAQFIKIVYADGSTIAIIGSMFLIIILLTFIYFFSSRNKSSEALKRELSNRIKSNRNRINRLPIPDIPTSEQEKVIIDFLKTDVKKMREEKFSSNVSQVIQYFSNLENNKNFRLFLEQVLNNESEYSLEQKSIFLWYTASCYWINFDFNKIDFLVEFLKKCVGLPTTHIQVTTHCLAQVMIYAEREDKVKYLELLNDKGVIDDLNNSGVIEEFVNDIFRKDYGIVNTNRVDRLIPNSYFSEVIKKSV
ncbi:hypothetical protein [Flagellimonas sp.]|uniref:hypothetical protein n=1 Tax=Flagellimonas sp. TaxID=2058762 RepID=UPI003B58D91E